MSNESVLTVKVCNESIADLSDRKCHELIFSPEQEGLDTKRQHGVVISTVLM